MKFASLLVLGTVVVSAVAQETTTDCSLVCSDEFEPVCGSDDITYQNECNMNLANCENPDAVTKAHDGECNISGSASWMAAMNDGPTMESVPMDAIPTDDACSDVCPTIYKPVCGSNGETYSNDCTLAFAQCTSAGAIIKASEGECPGHSSSESTECSEVCIEILKPVCGSDGITYPNSCFLGIAACKDPSVTQVSEGECPKEPESGNTECSEVCITIFQPVCGSDGVTYPNSCFLGIATCKDPSVTFVSDGECSKTYGSGNEDAQCSEVCIEILKPVCGSDGITYPNSCFLGIATCKDPSITQVKEGACTTNEGNYDTNSSSTDSNEETIEDTEKPSEEYAPSCPDVCLTIYSPVCGSDGVTYSNSCKLGIASCNHPELHLTKVSDGSCSSECKTQL